MAVSHDYSVARTNKSLFWENCMTNTISPDIKEIFDVITFRPVTEDFSLFCSFTVLCWCNVINYSLDFCAVKYTIHSAFNQVIDCNRSCNFVTEYTVKLQHVCVWKWGVYKMFFKNLLSNCFSHNVCVLLR